MPVAISRPRVDLIRCLCLHLLLSTTKIHSHHPPGQILHTLLVGQPRFGAAVQLPYLGTQGVLFLQLIGVVESGGSSVVVVPVGKGRIPQQLISSLGIGGGEIQIGAWGIVGLEVCIGVCKVREVGGRQICG